MGYNLHITRGAFHSDPNGPSISLEEWERFIRDDSELSLDPAGGPHCARWGGNSTLANPRFTWANGSIHTQNPDDAVVVKMLQIAARLGAQVQGDDGAWFGGVPKARPNDRQRDWVSRASKKLVPFLQKIDEEQQQVSSEWFRQQRRQSGSKSATEVLRKYGITRNAKDRVVLGMAGLFFASLFGRIFYLLYTDPLGRENGSDIHWGFMIVEDLLGISCLVGACAVIWAIATPLWMEKILVHCVHHLTLVLYIIRSIVFLAIIFGVIALGYEAFHSF